MSPLAAPQDVRHYAWLEAFCLPHESAMGRLQKFAWANAMSATNLAQQLFSKHLPSDPGSLDLFEGRWTRKCAVRLPPGLVLAEGFADAHGLNWMKLLCQTEEWRYCEECLAVGFHSLLHQIEGLTRCPQHQTPFRTTCRHCNSAASLTLSRASFRRVFCCPNCQEPLGSAYQPQRWAATDELVSAIQASLARIAVWLRKLSSFSLIGERAPLSQLALAGVFEKERDTVVAFSIARHLLPLELPDQCGLSVRRPLKFVELSAPQMARDQVVSQLEAHERKRSLFRAISSHLLKTVLIRHRRCLPAARHAVWMRDDVKGMVLEQEPGACPVAAGFVRWQKRFWAQSAIERRFDPALVTLKVPLPTGDFALNLLAQFHSAVATAYVCEALRRRGEVRTAGVALALRDLMQHHSCGAVDADASWVIEGETNAAFKRWMVMGTESFTRAFDH